MNNALSQALPLLERPPETPDTTHGYLDLLGPQPTENPGAIQALWASGIGSTLYDHAQSLGRRLIERARPPSSTFELRPGARALDVGCGPGNITGQLGRAAGPDGLALGLDVSEPMLRRAVAAEAADNVGFLRADARRLPFRDGSFDVVTSLAALQLIPEPMAVLAEFCRVLADGGRATIMVPTARDHLLHRLVRLTGDRSGLEFFDPEQIADCLQANGMPTVHTRQMGTLVWTTARKG